jgi:nucleoside-diphosphate-sugar epimerase
VTTLIVGCGYLGRRIGLQLRQAGDRVLGTVRSAPRAKGLIGLGIEPVIADVLDPSSLRSLPRSDRVVYAVGFDRSAGVPMREVYVDGLRNVLAACDGSTTRMVYVSSTSVYGGEAGDWVDESSPTEPRTESGLVCLDAERLLAEASLRWVVVRYSGLYGPGRLIRRAVLERGEPILGCPERWLNLMHVDDAARAAVAALERGAEGEMYLASDDRPVTRREYYERAARLLGAPPPRFAAAEAESGPDRGEEAGKRVSNRRLKEELGVRLAYPEISSGLPAALSESG